MISLIVVVDNNDKNSTKNFLSNFSNHALKKNINNLQMIFVFQNEIDNSIDLVNDFIEKNKLTNSKIIYSSKRLSFNQLFNSAIKLVNNEYMMIIDSKSIIEKEWLNPITNVIKKSNADLIEFDFKFKGLIKWNPKKRLNIKPLTTLNIKNDPKVISYIFPLIQNKIFKTKIALKSLSLNNFDVATDSSNFFSIKTLYLMLLNIKTYLWVEGIKFPIVIDESSLPSSNNLLKEWDEIQIQYENENKYISEIRYAMVFYLQIIIPGIYTSKSIKNIFSNYNVLLNKYYDKLLKTRENKFLDFNIENQYMLTSNEETKILKEILPINKWAKIFPLLEK